MRTLKAILLTLTQVVDRLARLENAMHKMACTLAEMDKTLALLRDSRPDGDLTDGIANIMSFDGKEKRDV